jgi:hypothetical protein
MGSIFWRIPPTTLVLGGREIKRGNVEEKGRRKDK